MTTSLTNTVLTQRASKSAQAVSQPECGHQQPRASKRVPATNPPFTVGDVRRAIPAHCFEHSLIISYGYLALDTAVALTLLYASTFIDATLTDARFGGSKLAGFLARHVCWTLYWIVQGIAFTSLWVLGHECGHGGFTKYETLNDITGFIVHSFLMVPYFSWKISHRRHHSNTGNIDRDEVFVPSVREAGSTHPLDAPHHDDNYLLEYWHEVKQMARRAAWIVITLSFGWPAYLACNVSGNKSYPANRWVNHFSPNSPIYQSAPGRPESPKNFVQIILSDLGLVGVVAVMVKLGSVYGTGSVVYMWLLPLMQNIMWLVTITYLQHTDISLPHYNTTEWDWLRGALATVDRSYGWLDIAFHHITDTHVVHHLFHTMPFYHAQEATAAVKPVLGDYYRYDGTPVAKAIWTNYGECDAVQPDPAHKGVFWYSPSVSGTATAA